VGHRIGNHSLNHEVALGDRPDAAYARDQANDFGVEVAAARKIAHREGQVAGMRDLERRLRRCFRYLNPSATKTETRFFFAAPRSARITASS
jgi:hypothetical protein